ncbi:hypothetical protein XENOCAPTIV_004577 [Xenoophorus captivus]|uniref:Uncharacterized protein n=1 Tax=Xenoophorus captivus TaxID=1517983 RepID=A0ABV0RU40_9TELE
MTCNPQSKCVCVCVACQRAGVISVWAPDFSQPPWPRLGLFPLRSSASNLFFLPNVSVGVFSSFSTWGHLFAPCFTSTNTKTLTHGPLYPSITLIAPLPIPSPLIGSAAEKPNGKGGVKPVNLEGVKERGERGGSVVE